MYPTTVHIMCDSVLAKRITNSLISPTNDVVICSGEVDSEVHSEKILMRGTPSQIEFL